ncbi:MAG: stressosome-associated protein Prli42 [Bacillus sp. (in: firmicutes)]
MSKKKVKASKIIIYLMIFAMLASTVLTGILMFI